MNHLTLRPTRVRLVVMLFSTLGLTCGRGDDSPEPIEAIHSGLTKDQTVLYQTSEATIIQDGDWVRWHFAKPLSDVVTTLIFRGARNADGGCDFTGTESATIQPSQSLVTRGRGIGININQCLMEMERAQVPAANALDPAAAPQAPGYSLNVSPLTEGGPDLQLQDAFYHHGYLSQYMSDPLSIHVTELWSHVDWNTAGNCIGTWQRYASWNYYWPTSWTLSSEFNEGTPGGTAPCNSVWEHSTAAFVNYAFCDLTATLVSSDARFTAYPLNSGGSWSYSVSGLCYWLLTSGYTYQPW